MPVSLFGASNHYSPGHVVDEISPVPLLLVHGTSDSVVSPRHSQLLYTKAEDPKTLWFVRYARHVQVFGRWAAEDGKHGLVDFYNEALDQHDQ